MDNEKAVSKVCEFTDLEAFTKAVEGAVLLKLDFNIATEIRKEIWDDFTQEKMIATNVRYWLIRFEEGLTTND